MTNYNCARIIFATLALFCSSALLAQEKPTKLELMPMPAKIEFQSGKFSLTDSFKIAITGNPNQRLYSGATRALRRLAGRTGLFFPQDFLRPDVVVDSPALTINCERPGQVKFGEDESYTLTIAPAQILLAAKTDLGALRGLETFLQLLAVDEQGYYFPSVKIEDAPRFAWRGLMIDASRHFMPVDVVKRNLDAMAAVKLNVLHWHLSDDQGFRVESKAWPKLHELGSDGFYYTQAQIREVIAYAAERGIRVMPEFDVPGHATSWVAAYPELGSAPGPYQIERKWGIFYPVLNPTKEFTYQFLDKFFGEMAVLFSDPYFHIGGDEIEHADYHEAKHWNESAEIQAFKKKHNLADNAAVQAHFNQRMLKILTKHGKIMVGWDEILHKSMPTNIIIQSWRGRESMVQAAQQGYQSLLANGYYIDLIQPTDFHYLNDPLPADLPLTGEQKKKILGGETTMWAEYVSPETVDSRIWPRTAAIAERFWSPQNVNDVDDMYRRLEVISFQLEEHGLTHEKNYAMMLRRLTRNQDITPLKNFVDVIEPVKIYNRGRLRPHTSYSPLTRVVDAARPDAAAARKFRRNVDDYLEKRQQNHTSAEQINFSLGLWRNNHAALLPVIKASPVLAEIESPSKDLSEISGIGLEALTFLEQNQTAAASWKDEKLEALSRAKEPRGQTELMVVSAIEKLVVAASEKR
ncbi:family 20 glycosylhydrolase [candidate division KSB1 bacterium]|nr:family 20 glycosylhydrolase [candidate division KSB1 bacterium]